MRGMSDCLVLYVIMYILSTAGVLADWTGGCDTIIKVKGLISVSRELMNPISMDGSKSFVSP